jgi:hypothetical protein
MFKTHHVFLVTALATSLIVGWGVGGSGGLGADGDMSSGPSGRPTDDPYGFGKTIKDQIKVQRSGMPLATSGANYPLLFSKKDLADRIGIVLNTPAPNFARCYFAGTGAARMAISSQFERHYLDRGFTHHSLCLGLAAAHALRFDPETGQRLPTFLVVADPAAIRKKLAADPTLDPQRFASEFSREYAMRIPDCFERGLPYSDCKMRFDPVTGKALTDDAIKERLKAGHEIEQLLAASIQRGDFCELGFQSLKKGDCQRVEKWGNTIVPSPLLSDKERAVAEGFLQPEGLRLDALSGGARSSTLDGSDAGLWDVTPQLPRGFGYALYVDLFGLPRAVEQKTGTVILMTTLKMEFATHTAVDAALAPERDSSNVTDDELLRALNSD